MLSHFSEYNGDMTPTKKTYPIEVLSSEEEKELQYLLSSIEDTISHEELMYLRYAKKTYAL